LFVVSYYVETDVYANMGFGRFENGGTCFGEHYVHSMTSMTLFSFLSSLSRAFIVYSNTNSLECNPHVL